MRWSARWMGLDPVLIIWFIIHQYQVAGEPVTMEGVVSEMKGKAPATMREFQAKGVASDQDRLDQAVGTSPHQDQTAGLPPDEDRRRQVVVGVALDVEGRGDEGGVEGHFPLGEEDLEATTLCVWVKPHHWYEYNIAVYIEADLMLLHNGRLLVTKSVVYIVTFDVTVTLRTWTHLCIVYLTRGFELFVDARPINPLHIQGQDTAHKSYVPSGNVTVKIAVSRQSYDFSGYVADPQMFPVALTQEQVQDVRAGITPDEGLHHLRGTRLVIDKVVAAANNSNNSTAGSSLTSFPYSELLKPHQNYTLLEFRSLVTHLEARQYCRSYGGDIPNWQDAEQQRMLTAYIGATNKFFETWVTNPSMDSQLCSMINYNPKIKFNLIDWPCLKSAFYLHCFVPKNVVVTLKGDIVQNDNKFIIVRDKNQAKNLTLEGVRELRVAWNGSRVQIQTTTGQVLYWKTPIVPHFLGRDTWTGSDQKPVNLSLSTCGEGEFSCTNGQCIPLARRCDAIVSDCDDFSDDDSSCWNFLGPPKFYFSWSAPQDPLVDVIIYIEQVRNVDGDSDQIQVVLQVTLSWRDNRLQFHNLRQSADQPNNFDVASLRSLWYPKLNFPMALFEENSNIADGQRMITSAILIPEGDGNVTQVDSYEALEYPGDEVIIQVTQTMLLTSRCPFDPSAFPFDKQICYLPVRLEGYGPPQVNTERVVVKGANEDLPMYRIYSPRCKVGHQPRPRQQQQQQQSPVQEVAVALMLKRRSEAFLLSVIGPCLVLGFLGHLTFVAYPLHKFDERTSTSVTLLIVVAALFSQAVSTLPETASPKAIDVWFFYFILRFFLFFVFHWLVELQYRLVTDAERKYDVTGHHNTTKGDSATEEALKLAGTENAQTRTTRRSPSGQSSSLSSSACDVQHLKQEFPRQQCWIRRGSPRPQRCSSAGLMSPHLMNRISLVCGLSLDAVFILSFYFYIQRKNNEVVAEFDSFHECI